MKKHIFHLLGVLAMVLSLGLITTATASATSAPTVTGISPASGPVSGGTPVTITGTGFDAMTGVTVTVGGASATGVTYVSPTSITAITPAGTAGARDLVVTSVYGTGTLPGGFTYVVPASMTVTYPNGGETWPTGFSQNITWISTAVSGSIKIELSSDGGATWATILASTLNDGGQAWTVVGSPTTQARVRISSVSFPSIFDISDANFTIPAASLTITSPNGGESWPTGSSQSVTWTSAYVSGNVKLEKSLDGGTNWSTVLASTPNDGIQAWTVTASPTTQARIRVTSVNIPSVFDVSDANFTIPPPSIEVSSPNGYETWAIGSVHNITWVSTSVTGLVKIEVSRYGGSSWTTLVASTANTGNWAWSVTGPGTTQGRVRVSSVSAPSVSDISNANFTIPPPNFTVTYPNGGETWANGSIQVITWTSVGVSGTVKVQLSRDNGAYWTTLAASTANTGSLALVASGAGTTQALVRVSSVLDYTIVDTSNADFTILPPTITVTAPNGGETWAAGSTHNFTWTSIGVTGNVNLDVSRDGGITWSTYVSLPVPASAGTYAWTVTGPGSTQALVRVSSVTYPLVRDTSNANFTITAPSIGVTAANGGETWAIGSVHNITWTSALLTGNVKIQLSLNGGSTWPTTIIASTPNTGSKSWTVTGAATTLARIKVSSVLNPSVFDVSDANFTLQPGIYVSNPWPYPGYPNLTVGTPTMIYWIPSGLTGNYKIELSRDNGTTWATLLASTPPSTLIWTPTGPGTTQAVIRISSVSYPSIYGTSYPFTIVEPGITVTSADGGENWTGGSSHNITWNSVGMSPTALVKIELSRASGDFGAPWTTVIASTPNDGSQAWTIPGPGTTTARVRVTSVSTPSVYDVSDADFTITAPSITVTYPNGGELWAVGSVQTLSWTMENISGNVKIEISRNSGATWTTLVASMPGLDLSWGGVSGPGTTLARVRVSSVSTPSVSDTSDANFIIRPTITVTAPNGGETWAAGSSHNITWTSAAVTGNVKIALSRDSGTSWTTLIASTANTGSWGWTVTGAGSTQALVKVSGVLDSAVFDVSDNDFTVTPPSLTVTYPNGGEIWGVGSTESITWSSAGVTGDVRIELSRDGGGSWSSIVASMPNTGSKAWPVTGPLTTQARIRVTSVSFPTATDTSNANFTITPQTITVTAPNGGETYVIGSSQAITWTSAAVSGNVMIRVSRDGGLSWQVLVTSTPNSGSWGWTVTGPGTTQTLVRVNSVSNPIVSDTGDANSTIPPPVIRVTNPNGYELWVIGWNHPITWTSSGVVGNVKIEITRNAGTTWTTLAASTPNSGSWGWIVTGPQSTQCRIRVTSVSTPTTTDISDNQFWIQ